MRSIQKTLMLLIIFVVSISIIGGTISLFLNKSGFLNINDLIIDKPILKYFASEKTYQDTVDSKIEDYEKQLSKKDDEIKTLNLTVSQLKGNSDSLLKDYKALEEEMTKAKEEKKSVSSDIIVHYNSMKDKKIAEVFTSMQNEEVVNILSQMEPTKVPKILENMDPKKVAEITKLFIKIQN